MTIAAVLGAQVRESNVQSYIGRRMLLTVDDSAETENPDRYTFGFYRSTLPTGSEGRGAEIRSGRRLDVDRHRCRA